jgi:predicted nucleotidyltransferase|tara:strand:+ start:1580 stop:2026 length:447 start_codon:yes stop_codon:yes gene_type:complete
VEVVNNIVNKCKSKYGDRFKYYLTGSYARNEESFKDYDIAIYDTENDNKDWESLLKLFFNKYQKDGKSIDAQISQYIPEVMQMTGQELYKNRDRIVKRYVYSDETLEDWEYIKYNNIYGNLWEKQIMLVKPKHRSMGLDKIQRIYMEI